MKPTCPKRTSHAGQSILRTAGGLFALGLAVAGLHAQPTDGTVVAGHATIETAPNLTTITAGNNSVLRWGSFDVPANETVRFVQPGADSRVLNWIGGLTPSQIDGSLLANGHVYLVNPAGVYFGQSAVVDAGRLYAIGGSLSKEDFLNGIDRFTGLTGGVGNAGSIRGEMVALIGRSVANSGSIVSSSGFIGLASGDQVLLGQDGSSIFVDAGKSVTADATPGSGTGVANSGTIDAGRGTAVLAAGDFYSIAITHDGKLAGRDIKIQGQGTGDVLVSGTIDASATGAGETGGRVEITGERVGLVNHASINASGPAGGGTILVGGDFQGKNSDIRNASATYVGRDVSLAADAAASGHGGKVIVWADDITRFFGSISARGGALGGNGGFAEVSGKGFLDFRGAVDLRAPVGGKGSLLLDPANITIQAAGPDIDGALSGATDDIAAATDLDSATLDFPGASSVITSGAVEGLLATTDLTLAATSNITVNDTVTWTSDKVLTLDAGSSINVNFALDNSGGTGGVTLISGGTISLAASVSGATVSLTNAGALTQSAGTITATTVNLSGSGAVGSGGTPLSTDIGTLVLSKSGGDTFISEADGLALQGSTLGNLSVGAAGNITQAVALSVTGTATFAVGANDITLNHGFNDFGGAVSVTNGDDVTLGDTNNIALGASSLTGNLSVVAQAISQTGALDIDGTASFNASANPITLTDVGNDFTGAVSLSNSGANDVIVTDVNALDLGTASVGTGTLTINAVGITQTGAITQAASAGAATFNGGAGAIALTNTSNNFTGAVSVNNTGAFDVAVTDTNTLIMGTSTVGQALALTAGGAITQTGAITATGGATTAAVTAANSDILLGTQANLLGASTLVFGGTQANIRDVSLRNTSGGATTPSFAGLTNLRNLTLIFNSAPITLPALTLTNGGNLVVSAGGAITQSGAATVPGTASFTAGANAITLTQANDFTGAVSLSNSGANNVAVTNTTALVLGTSSVGQNLALTAGGNITQTGALTASGGTTTVAVTAATSDILLGTQANNLGTSALVFGGTQANIRDVSLRNTNAGATVPSFTGLTNLRNLTLIFNSAGIALPAFTLAPTGNLVVSAGGAITQSGALVVPGTASFTAGANAITLTQSNDFTGAVSLSNSGANAVAVTDSSAIILGASSVGQNLTITASGSITQTGALTVPGAASFTAGANAITLTTGTNNFTGAVSLSNSGGANAAVTNANALALGTSSVGNDLTVTATGAITQTGALTVAAGTTTLAAGTGNNITLSGANNFNAVAITSGNNVTLNDTNALVVGASTVSGTLNVTTAGTLSDAGALTVTGTTTLAAGAGNDITFNDADNFSTVVITSGNNVTLADTNALVLGASTVSGTLNVTAGGNITQSGALNVTGTTTVAVTAAASDILLGTQANNLGASALVFGGTVANIHNVSVRNTNASVLLPNFTGLTGLNDLTLFFDNAAITVPAFTLSGSLAITAGGDIAQSGALVVPGTASFTTGSFAITLTNPANDFTGAVSLNNTGANNVAVTDINVLVLGTSSLGQNLTVTADGDITQTAALVVPGTASFTAGAHAITLTTPANDFTGAVSLSNSGAFNVAVTDTNAINLGIVAVGTGTLTVTANTGISQSGAITQSGGALTASFAAGAGAITLNGTTNDFTGSVALSNTGTNDVTVRDDTGGLQLGQSNVGRDLTVQSTGGNITLEATKTLVVPGVLRLIAGANHITLDEDNTLNRVVVQSGNNVTIKSISGPMFGDGLGSVSTVTGNLAVTSSVGAVTQSEALLVTGTTTVNAGTGGINLSNSANDFTGAVSLSGANAVAITDLNAIDLGTLSVGTGTLTVNAVGITQSGIITTGGAAVFNGGAAAITLLNASNDFTGAVSLNNSGANDVAVVDTSALILGTSSVGRNLSITAGSHITQTGALTVTGGITTVEVTNPGSDILLHTQANDFGSNAIVFGGNQSFINDVGLRNISAIAVQPSYAGLTNLHSLTLIHNNAAIDLPAFTLSGTLTVTAGGPITDSGVLSVAGTTTLAAGSSNDITLDEANNFSTVIITSGNNVTLNDTDALVLGASTISGTLDVTTGGAITQSGALAVTGAATLAAGSGNDITLSGANNFSTVAITSGNNVALNDTNALVLGTSTISGTLNVTTAGTITDSGNVSVTGTTTLTAGAGNNITLDNADDFSTVVITSGNNVTLNDTSALDLGASTISGTLNVTTAGAITQSGALAVTGAATLAAGSGNDISLNGANNFSTVAITSGNNVVLNDTNALVLGTSTISGTLNVTTAGTITDSGNVSVAGITTLAAGAGNNITLDNADNFSTVVITSGNNVTLADTSALNLGTSTVSGTLNLTAGGHITQSGVLNVTGGTTVAVTAALSDILLGTQANNLGTTAPVFAGTTANIRDVSLRNTNAGAAVPTFAGLTNLGSLTLIYNNAAIVLPTLTAAGNLTVTAGGTITDSGVLTVAGTTTLTAGAGNNITLDNADNFGTVAIISGNNVVLNDTSALDLGASTISGTLAVTTAGAITDSGAVSVAGTTTLAAGAGNNITLDNTDNFSTVIITNGNNVTLTDTNALNLGASTVSGALTVNAGGAITDSGNLAVTGTGSFNAGGNAVTLGDTTTANFGALTVVGGTVAVTEASSTQFTGASSAASLTLVSGGAITQTGGSSVGVSATASLNAAGANVTLAQAGNDFGTVILTSVNTATLVDANAINLGPFTLPGTLTVTAGGDITDAGALTVTGTTTLAAGGNITFDNADNFSTVVITSGNNVTLNDTNALILGASTVSGALNVTTAGTITQSGALAVAGAATLTAGAGNNITLAGANNFNSVAITSGNNVILNDTSALDLGTSTVSGALTVTTAGAITDSGNVSVVGLTTLTAGAGNSITLDNADNFSTVVVTSGNNVTLNDTNALVLGASTISGGLNVTTAGTITQSGVLAVTGAATLAAGSGNDITLAGANSFSSVGITSGNNVILNDTTGTFDLGASNVSGTLNVTAVGAITDSGAVTVAGTTTLTAGAGNNITLDNAGNFSTVVVTSANNLTLVDTNALNLGTSTLAGALTLTAGSHITQSGVLTVPGLTTLAVTGAGSDILLGTQPNGLGTLAPVFAGTTANIRDVSLRNLNAGALVPDFTGLTNLRNLTLLYDNAPVVLSTLTASGTLTVTAGGAISDSGNVSVVGVTTLAAGAGNNITLDNADNFSTVVITSGNNVVLNDTSALDLGASTVSGTLTVTTAGAITDSGAVTAAGTTTLTAGAGNNITLDNADNFSTVIINSANNVTLVDTNALDLGTSTLSGGLTLTAGSHITQSGVLTVPGLTTLAVTGAGSDILLGTQPNDLGTLAPVFVGAPANVRDVSLRNLNPGAAMSVFTGLTNLRNLTITYDNAAIVLPAIAASGFLNVTAGGTITDAPGIGLSAGGLATFTAGTSPITLGDDPADTTNFGSLTFTGGTVTITEDSATNLTGINTAAGVLTLTTAGNITDDPGTTLNVSGLATLNAGGNAITLGDDPADTTNFGKVVFTGGAVDLTEDSSMIAQGTASVGLVLHGVGVDLAGISTPVLGVYSTGPLGITDSVATNVIGSAVFEANGYDIILDETQNDYDTIQLAGATVAINDVNALGIAGALASGPFTAIATTRMNVNTTLNGANTISLTVLTGDLTVSAPISVATGNILLTAGQNVVTNSSGPLAALSSTGAIIIKAGANAQIANLVSAGGKITVDAAGSARFTDPLQLAGLFTVNASSVAFDSTLNGNGGDLMVNTAGTTRFSAPIGATSPLHTLTTNVGGTTEIAGGVITTSGAQTYNDAVVLAANATLTGVGNTFARTVNGPFALTVTDSGTTTFADAVGTTTALASLTTTAGGKTAINGGAITTTGSQEYNNDVVLGNNTTFTVTAANANLTFNNTVTTAATGSALLADSEDTGLTRAASTGESDLTANVAGVTTFNSTVGNASTGRVGEVTTNEAGRTEINANFYATKATFNDDVTLGGTGTAAFTLDTTGTQTFNGTVQLNADLTFYSTEKSATEGIKFKQSLSGANRKVTLVARDGAISIAGSIGAENARFSTVSSASRNLVIGADIWSEGDITLAIGTGNPDSGPDTNDFLSFNVPGATERSTRIDSATGEIRLGSGASAGTTAKTGSPLRASLFKSNEGDLYLFARKITIQPFERLAVRQGSLIAITDGPAAGDGITLSDTAVSNYLVLASNAPLAADGQPASAFLLRSRAGASVDNDGVKVNDVGTYLVAGAVLFYSGNFSQPNTPTPTRAKFEPGTGDNQFDYEKFTGNIQSRFGPLVLGVLPVAAENSVFIADLLNENRFRFTAPGVLLQDLSTATGFAGFKDGFIGESVFGTAPPAGAALRALIVQGATLRSPVENIFAPNVPREDIPATPPEPDLAAAVREQLQALGIYARALTPTERLARERQEALYVAVPERVRPVESDYEVADARVEDKAVREVIRLAFETGLLGEGQAKLDAVAHALDESYKGYRDANDPGDKATTVQAAEYRAWLEANRGPDSTKVLEYVQALHATFERIKQLGLTTQELEGSKAQIYGSVLRARLNVEPEFLRALVETASSDDLRNSKRKPADQSHVQAENSLEVSTTGQAGY